jgi:methionine biosynthesis protein MetW
MREDFAEILRLVPEGARVLDVGCAEGVLLDLLVRRRGADARGLEISPTNVSACLARGLAVMQGDADHDLREFPAGAFDYVILSQTLQAMQDPRAALGELMRIGERALVTVPNFGHWRVRLDLLLHGRMPVTGALPEPWWSTPNIHLCTLADFIALTDELGLEIESCAAFAAGRRARAIRPSGGWENWRAEAALFVLRRKRPRAETPRQAPSNR